ncbi:hypothetical protein LJ756_09180 [Arthrobacter sp. zg-Y411]|uniref:hypothetical protein n=1 Tax=Arthrobacter zhangbolii TaxID=2886936 RepID=UPI001D141EFA|nr:hypothetical protein [Arthrobacter zhangbolii]MCC3294795.1 hypothetical protein [Arthrobacter zhangbolii]
MRPGVEGGPDTCGGTRQEQDETGSAVVEFIFLGLLLLVPVVYLVITVGQIQGASFAAVGAADAAAKVYATAPDPATAERRATEAAQLALDDFGLPDGTMDMLITCPADCLAPGSLVTVRVTVDVPLPGLPWAGDSPVVVDSESTQVVERFG